jgi:hypothetical protein
MIYVRNKHGEVELITLDREFQPGDDIVTEMNEPVAGGKEPGGNYLVQGGDAGLGSHGDLLENREGKSGIGKAPGGGDPKELSVKLSHDAKESDWKVRGLTKKYDRCVVCGKDLNLALGKFRKSNSKYCSNKCVNRAKYLRRAKTLKAQRDAKKGAK